MIATMQVMKYVDLAIPLLECCAGLISAWYWYRSSRIQIEPSWTAGHSFEPVEPSQSQAGWIVGVLQAASLSSELNKTAARWTAATVALNVLPSVIKLWFP